MSHFSTGKICSWSMAKLNFTNSICSGHFLTFLKCFGAGTAELKLEVGLSDVQPLPRGLRRFPQHGRAIPLEGNPAEVPPGVCWCGASLGWALQPLAGEMKAKFHFQFNFPMLWRSLSLWSQILCPSPLSVQLREQQNSASEPCWQLKLPERVGSDIRNIY